MNYSETANIVVSVEVDGKFFEREYELHSTTTSPINPTAIAFSLRQMSELVIDAIKAGRRKDNATSQV